MTPGFWHTFSEENNRNFLPETLCGFDSGTMCATICGSHQALGSQYAVPRFYFLRWLTMCDHGTPYHRSTREKSGLVEAVTPSKEEPGEMEGEVYPETMSQLAPTKTISPKEHLTSRKRVCVCMLVAQCSDSVTPWTAAHQAPLSKEFSRQEYWSG